MIDLVLNELEKCEGQNSFANSNMIVSCINLLAQFQLQTKIISEHSQYYEQYSVCINRALKHSNPQVRKEGEALFKIMCTIIGDKYTKQLKDQKT